MELHGSDELVEGFLIFNTFSRQILEYQKAIHQSA